jgi:G3E family GTPase
MLDLFPSADAGPFGRRQKHARAGRIPVTVLTGFLGAGKTTLLKRFLATPEGQGTAVIVNEYGAVGIDDALVRGSADEVALLGNGCICCVTRSDLQVTLRRLLFQRGRGEVPAFGRVVIETSGLADPGPILQTFATDRALGGEFFIEVVVAAVDAATGLETLGWAVEARKQAILADRLIITKGDLADPSECSQLAERLRLLNPHAAIETARDGVLDPHCLCEPGGPPRLHAGFVSEGEHSDGIVSFVLSEDAPLVWATFARSMDTLIAMRGPDLLRVKGLLDVEGCRGPVLVQFVQHLAHPPVELAAWDGPRSSRLVFITRGIIERQVRDLIGAVGALAGPAR